MDESLRVLGQAAAESGQPGERGRAEVAALPLASILLVEDELVVAMGVRRFLEAAGHRVCGVAATADAAVALARAHAPDVVLMDVTLKGARDGVVAAAEILAAQSPVLIFVTAHSDPTTQARMAALRPAAILAKPFTERQLHQTIAHALGGWTA